MKLQVDPTRSRLIVRTRATGMLARLAHDLQLVATEVRGAFELEAIDGTPSRGPFSGAVEVSVDAFRVAGALHGERLDPSALSSTDRAEIERKIVAEVFPSVRSVSVDVRGEGGLKTEVSVRAGAARADARATELDLRATGDGAVCARGRCELSLKALGAGEVRGPLGAFKIADGIVVLAELSLRPA